MCFYDDWFLLFQSLCPSFSPRITTGTTPEQVLQRETISSQRLLCQHQERLSFHQPKVRISSCFSYEFQQKMFCFTGASRNPKATKFLSTGRTCLWACWTSITKRRVSWQVNTPRPWLPRASTHLWAQFSHIRNSSFGGGLVFFSGVGYFKPMSDAVSHQPKRTGWTPASLSVSHKELNKQSTAILAYGYHHSAPQMS